MQAFSFLPENSSGPLGFKVLRLEDTRILSAVADFTWTSALSRMAYCKRCGSSLPGEDCLCGLHASYDAGLALDLYFQHRNRALVFVEGQGKVICHQRGWRAEACAVHAVVELCAGNMPQHIQNARVKVGLALGDMIRLEDAIQRVQNQRMWMREVYGDW